MKKLLILTLVASAMSLVVSEASARMYSLENNTGKEAVLRVTERTNKSNKKLLKVRLTVAPHSFGSVEGHEGYCVSKASVRVGDTKVAVHEFGYNPCADQKWIANISSSGHPIVKSAFGSSGVRVNKKQPEVEAMGFESTIEE